jgi:hypothetical protein
VNLAQETRKGQWQVIREGGWPGTVAWGYEKDENGWVKLAAEAERVSFAFREFSTGNYTLAEWVQVACAIYLPDHTAIGNQIDGALLLALKVTPTVGDLYYLLETDEQRHAICRMVIAQQGLKVQGDRIVDVQPSPPFAIVPGFGSPNPQYPRGDSNARTRLRRPLLYPLSYGGL